MPLDSYGVLKGRPISSRLGFGDSPHYQVHLVDHTTDYRIAINVKSRLSPSELLYLIVDDFRHPVLELLAELDEGFTRLPSQPGGAALDFIRGNLFDRDAMRPLAHDIPGADNDLNEKIDAYISRALADEEATVYAFGERWGPEPHRKDRYFGFLPGNGIHDIHMNQGNHSSFARADGVWQDGALLIHFPAIHEAGGGERWPEQWVAVFLAFQSQSWHTDDATGHALTGEGSTGGVEGGGGETGTIPGERDRWVRIAAALVNPAGDQEEGRESVTLINAAPVAVDLTGWKVADGSKRTSPLPAGPLAAGEALRVVLDGSGARLSNRGGILTLLDQEGIKIDGVSYDRAQARRQGWTLVF